VACAAVVALLPLLQPGGPANSAPVDLLIGIALSAAVFWAVSSGQTWRFPYAFPMLLILTGGAIGAMSGTVPIAGATALAQDVVLLAWCWAVVNVCRSADNLKILVRTWAYSSLAWAGLLFVGLATSTSALTGRTPTFGSRTMLTFGDPNVAANYLVISIMIIWATQCPRRRAPRLAGYGLLLAALATTGSNGGIVGIIVAVTVAAVLGVYVRAGTVPAVTMLCFLVLGGYLVATNIHLSRVQETAQASRYAFLRDGIGREESSVASRGSILHESIKLYQGGGPFGAGPGSTKPRLQAEEAPLVKEAHDDYLAALNERGVLGLVGLVLLLSGIALRALSLVKTPPARGVPAVVVRPNALVGAVAATMVAMAVVELLHVRHVWTLFAFVAALSLWGREWREAGPP
jgi:O-antigen ligase